MNSFKVNNSKRIPSTNKSKRLKENNFKQNESNKNCKYKN